MDLDAVRRALSAWWVKLLVSAILVAWLAWSLDWSTAWALTRQTPPLAIAAQLVALMVGQLLGAIRWGMLLKGFGLPVGTWQAIRLNFLGTFTSRFLPGSVGGDAVKATVVVRKNGHLAEVIASVFLDRVMNTSLIGMTFLVLFHRLTLTLDPAKLQATLLRVALLTAAAGVAALLGFCALRDYRRRIAHESSSSRRLLQQITDGIRKLVVLRHRPGLLAIGLGLSAVMLAVGTLGSWILLRGLQVQLAYVDLLAVLVSVHFVMILPVTFNGLGLSEVSLVILLGLLGVDPAPAGAFAIITRAVFYVISLPGLWYYLPGRRS